MVKKIAGLVLLHILLWGAYGVSAGESVKIYGRDNVPEPDEVADMLRAQKNAANNRAAGMKTRGISLDAPNAATPESASTALAEQAGAFALQINFDLDSVKVDPAFLPHLSAIAKGIDLSGTDLKIVVEGHTDARGSPQYNDQLSLRRAQSVRALLIEKYGIQPGNVSAVGRGQAQLADVSDPYSGKNRRVQFRVAE